MTTMVLSRWIPTGSTEISLAFDAVAYVRPSNHREGGLTAIGYSGKRNKHDFHYTFRDQAKLDTYLANWVDGIRQKIVRKAEATTARREQAAKGHEIKVGDVFRYSWGYDQTNVDYFQVISTTKASVVIREIASETVEQTGFMSSNVRACPNAFVADSKPMTKRVIQYQGGEPSLKMDHSYAHPDKGGTSYCSWYA